MRGLLSIPFVIAAAYAHSAAYGDDSPLFKQRPTMGKGPVHPHAVFRTSPSASSGFVASEDPLQVARAFLREQSLEDGSFAIRSDSYTDSRTGVSHVYVRQLVNGLEVADGDMNLNIKDGVVISHGNSFYTGAHPTPGTNPGAVVSQALHCDRLTTMLSSMQSSEQQVFGNEFRQLAAQTQASCETRLSHDAPVADPKDVLLEFLSIAVHDTYASTLIQKNAAVLREKMTSTFESHLVGDHATMVEIIDNVPETVSPVKAKLAYVQVQDGDATALSLVWKYEVEMSDNWYEASLSASAPHHIVSVVDWISDSPMPTFGKSKIADRATYNVFPWGVNDPSEGDRTVLKENVDSLASPVGWHTLPFANDPASAGVRRAAGSPFYRNTTTTWGNNAFAHENWEGRNDWEHNYRPDAGNEKAFDFKYSPSETEKGEALAEAQKYINATVTQLFYTTNMYHDLLYRYGFDELSGNFQQYNFGKGGAQNDGIIVNAQDGSGYNNANFATPPDGQNGRCRMYLWNTASPYRDGDLEAGIVIHELSHGLSTRLTGGPANSGCLGWGESGGMGEGWGDFIATSIRAKPKYQDYPMGAWAANTVGGIRNFPYSTNDTVNPSTYKTLDKPGYWGVHAIGEVWAQILWVVQQRLIAKHGFSDTLFPPAPAEDGSIPIGDFYREAAVGFNGKPGPLVPKHGNTLSVQLVVDGMKLQPCRPSFFDARDAIIQADKILTGGENQCELWLGFAEKGLGPDARVEGRTPWGGGVRFNDFAVPSQCKDGKKHK